MNELKLLIRIKKEYIEESILSFSLQPVDNQTDFIAMFLD